MISPALASVLARPVAEKLARLQRMCPYDATGVEMMIDLCLQRNWTAQFTLIRNPPQLEARRP